MVTGNLKFLEIPGLLSFIVLYKNPNSEVLSAILKARKSRGPSHFTVTGFLPFPLLSTINVSVIKKICD